MALPSSGAISALDMRNETGETGAVDIAAMGAIFGVDPAGGYAFSEFYGLAAGTLYPTNVTMGQVEPDVDDIWISWDIPTTPGFTVSYYKIWNSIDNSGSWFDSGLTSTGTYTEFAGQFGRTVYGRVQAIGTGGEKSPSDADMVLSGTTYPPTDSATPEDGSLPTT